ncbi:hypothetical protein [Lysinibacillus fusiformis]|uniref:hypothetical protein n=1 Tax=Lysinibacillus fusiformis TaxID=28031 RepID=UPI0020C105CE|nr:hypothetical protein [Lysinibacillus fusiformis]
MKQSENSTKFRHSRTCERLLIKLGQLYKKSFKVSIPLIFSCLQIQFSLLKIVLVTMISQSHDTYGFGLFTIFKNLLSPTEKFFFSAMIIEKKDCKIAICDLYWRL